MVVTNIILISRPDFYLNDLSLLITGDRANAKAANHVHLAWVHLQDSQNEVLRATIMSLTSYQYSSSLSFLKAFSRLVFILMTLVTGNTIILRHTM